MAVRILLIDPDSRDGHVLRDHLHGLRDIESVFSASDGKSALDLLPAISADIAIADFDLPDISCSTLIGRMSQKYPRIKTLIYTARADHDSIWAAFDAGAAGYLLKERSETEIGAALQTILGGKSYICASLTHGTSPEIFLERLRLARFYQRFTPREIEILECLKDAMSQPEIAEKLNIDVETVRSHLKNIRNKLDIRKSIQIARYLIENKLFP